MGAAGTGSRGRDFVGAIGGIGAAGFFAQLSWLVAATALFAGVGDPPAIIAGAPLPGEKVVLAGIDDWLSYAEFASAMFSGAVGGFLGVLVICAFVTRGRWLAAVIACVMAGTARSSVLEKFLSPMLFVIWPTEWAAIAGAAFGGLLGMVVGSRLHTKLGA